MLFHIDVLGQTDSVRNIIIPYPDFQDTVIKSPEHIVKVQHIFNRDVGAGIEQYKNDFYKREYDENGNLIKRAKVRFILKIDSNIVLSDTIFIDVVNHIEVQLHGNYREWDVYQNIVTVGRFYDGKKDGMWRYFNSEGVVTKKEKWKQGLLRSTKVNVRKVHNIQ
ncbi:MAG: hypothetical protein KBB37_10370 [Bacteroidia bacterium]|nr:hypothetical protein [Bacteroidia bacterium]MBP7261680.1 hypothetical protein [Bacteroidia bacterium]